MLLLLQHCIFLLLIQQDVVVYYNVLNVSIPDDSKDNFTLDKDMFLKERDEEYGHGQQKVTATLIQQEPLVKECLDSNYWKVDMYQEKSVEELMAEMGV